VPILPVPASSSTIKVMTMTNTLEDIPETVVEMIDNLSVPIPDDELGVVLDVMKEDEMAYDMAFKNAVVFLLGDEYKTKAQFIYAYLQSLPTDLWPQSVREFQHISHLLYDIAMLKGDFSSFTGNNGIVKDGNDDDDDALRIQGFSIRMTSEPPDIFIKELFKHIFREFGE
jgi:hypothetical protein